MGINCWVLKQCFICCAEGAAQVFCATCMVLSEKQMSSDTVKEEAGRVNGKWKEAVTRRTAAD